MFLGQCENRSFHLMTTQNLYAPIADTPPPTLVLTQPSPIVDFIWYPTATPRDPASFCFVGSVRDCPVKLLDARDGRLRASYPIIDHRERFIAPHSLAFNLTGQKLYCGFEDAIEVFDVAHPGEGTRLATTPNKKSKDGLKGIVSALAFSPSYESELFAAGSLTPMPGNIALFNESQGATPVMFVEGGPEGGAAVTQLHFNPMQPHILYASFRRRNEIYSWDLRATTMEPVQIFDPLLPASAYDRDDVQEGDGHRSNQNVTQNSEMELTNQKRRFDVDISGKWLGIGGQEGTISIFNTSNSGQDMSIPNIAVSSFSTSAAENENRTPPTLKWSAANDAIGSVAFNPVSAVLLAVAGSRHFVEEGLGEESDSGSELESQSGEDNNEGYKYKYRVRRRQPVVKESAVKIWSF
ncbi:hypothetical protein VKT23_020487 [Stygiomarasmius scandens]